MNCPSCESENRASARFCRECGASLAERCPDCGSLLEPGQRYCDGCGSQLSTSAGLSTPRREPVAERRLVSVLFADLVGFTALSDSRDPEEARELLSRYFDTCRRLVDRYGGTVEKFIGDAVMAVWGTPTANEDDAERAVRTALDLVAAVSGLADEIGAEGLRLRAGVLTGEAAVTVGAVGEGMVAGDLVNTAARVQAEAEPGTVLVGDATRRATEAAIAYEEAGFRHLKGKNEPQRLHRALRVIAARRGEGRAAGLEPPFVGREREFALVKDLFHACAEERRARLVSIVGVAGIGKSRLSWEFEKYLDGLADGVRWHRGRCLAYGDGVSYWALAEMVRMRARIAEEDAPEAALAKLRESLVATVSSVEERSFLEPRLAHLLGLAVRSAPDKEDLFSAWRLFFERMAEREPVVLVFEDLQWADSGLLDFIEYLLDWSRSHAIYVLTLARPELAERRSGWGAGRRSFTSLFLEPLEAEVEALLNGLAPGLPRELRERIVERAEGVPLYAVETVRMLLDRGLLIRVGDEYRPPGPIETLAVPETLHALAAARLDALEAHERRLLEDAAVLGRSFRREGLAALSGLTSEQLEPTLQSLLRKEILSIQADPLSPEQNHISFVQDLLRRVAYETLSVHSRKERHLAAAAYLEQAGDDELAAVIAAHLLDAYRAAVGHSDDALLRQRARAALTRAADRASSLASAAAAAEAFTEAAALADDPAEEAQLLERAGLASLQDGALDDADALLARAAALVEEAGLEGAALRIASRRAEVFRSADRVGEAVELLTPAYEAAAKDEPDPDVARAAAELARVAYFAGDRERALEAVETALEMAEALQLPEVVAEALTTKSFLFGRRPHESLALLKEGLAVARAHDLARSALRAQFNLTGMLIEHDRMPEAQRELEAALATARQRGDRDWEHALIGQLVDVLVQLGEWDAAEALVEAPDHAGIAASIGLTAAVRLLAERGDLGRAQSLFAANESMRTSSDLQARASLLEVQTIIYRNEGRYADAIESAEESLSLWHSIGAQHYAIETLAEGCLAAFDMGDIDRVQGFLDAAGAWPLIERRALLAAHEALIRARLLAARGEPADAEFETAAARFRELELPFWIGVTLLEHGRSKDDAGEAEAPLAEATAIFERLRARPWLERVAGRSGSLAFLPDRQ